MIAESTTFYMLGWIDHIRPINLSSELGLLGSPNKDERVEQSTQAGWTYLLNKSTQPDSLKVDFLKKKSGSAQPITSCGLNGLVVPPTHLK